MYSYKNVPVFLNNCTRGIKYSFWIFGPLSSESKHFRACEASHSTSCHFCIRPSALLWPVSETRYCVRCAFVLIHYSCMSLCHFDIPNFAHLKSEKAEENFEEMQRIFPLLFDLPYQHVFVLLSKMWTVQKMIYFCDSYSIFCLSTIFPTS